MEHPFHINIIRIFTITQHLFPYIQPVHPAAHFPIFRRFGYFAGAENFRRHLHGADDLYITRAAADVVPQRMGDFLLRGGGVLIQQRLGAHNHARDAEAALHGSGLAKSISVGFLLKIREALHRKNGFSFHAVGLLHAAFDRLAVD
ncbi:hypothetical protein SDC9_184049 [bioreactor metagenome]|uniref:Uncharacterized protein n=1 Tax=bioreactor metagenome TaxID=1076179 RepID=A0A645HCT6_9ZZZZ